jgi:hypothetical protein
MAMLCCNERCLPRAVLTRYSVVPGPINSPSQDSGIGLEGVTAAAYHHVFMYCYVEYGTEVL